jgi:hypothetical protein
MKSLVDALESFAKPGTLANPQLRALIGVAEQTDRAREKLIDASTRIAARMAATAQAASVGTSIGVDYCSLAEFPELAGRFDVLNAQFRTLAIAILGKEAYLTLLETVNS